MMILHHSAALAMTVPLNVGSAPRATESEDLGLNVFSFVGLADIPKTTTTSSSFGTASRLLHLRLW